MIGTCITGRPFTGIIGTAHTRAYQDPLQSDVIVSSDNDNWGRAEQQFSRKVAA
jgi:hypothetical protein